jgi:ferric-dicitrate binding protein FerR (iron transport regulator)
MSSDDRKNEADGWMAEEREALQALALMPRPRSTDQARQKAKAAFLSGEPGSGDGPRSAVVDLPDRDEAAGGRPPALDRRRSGFWSVLPLAAALAIAVLATWFGMQPVDSWFITDVVKPVGVGLQAEAVVTGAVVQAGALETAPGSEVELQLGEHLRMRMLPESRAVLPKPPGRWFDRVRVVTLEQGEVYGTTGGEPLGFTLRFDTLELTAELTGTTFAVFRTEEGSCVCLWSGAVQVTRRDSGQSVTMEPETRYLIYKDGRPSQPEPINDMERMKLQMMHDGGLLPVPGAE